MIIIKYYFEPYTSFENNPNKNTYEQNIKIYNALKSKETYIKYEKQYKNFHSSTNKEKDEDNKKLLESNLSDMRKNFDNDHCFLRNNIHNNIDCDDIKSTLNKVKSMDIINAVKSNIVYDKNLINKFFDIFTNLSDDFRKNLDYLYKNYKIEYYSFSSKEFLQISNNIKALKEYEECLQKLYDSINNLNENEIN